VVEAGTHTGERPRDEEAALVSRVRQGDLAAFEELIRPYEGRVYGAILRVTHDRTEAADVYQDALLSAFEKLDGFRGDAAFGSWLHRIAVNYALMRLRAPAHTRVVSEEDLPRFNWMGMHARPVRNWAESAEAPAHRTELRAALRTALAALPELDRAIVWLKEAEGESHEEIAAATGLTVPATRTRLHRARLALRAKLAQYVGEER
jgi:RNA polymerase sigma-70 factor (ECF subfamily)